MKKHKPKRKTVSRTEAEARAQAEFDRVLNKMQEQETSKAAPSKATTVPAKKPAKQSKPGKARSWSERVAAIVGLLEDQSTVEDWEEKLYDKYMSGGNSVNPPAR